MDGKQKILTKHKPFKPAKVPGRKNSGWVLSSSAEAIRRQPLPRYCMDNLQMGTTGKPSQSNAALTFTHREKSQEEEEYMWRKGPVEVKRSFSP